MSIVGTRAPSVKMPVRLLSMPTQRVPAKRSSRSRGGTGGGGKAKPRRSSGMSHPLPYPTITSRPGAKTYLIEPTKTVSGEAGNAEATD
jgi:hypothetical protein